MDTNLVVAIVSGIVTVIVGLFARKKDRALVALESDKLQWEREKAALEARPKEAGGMDFTQVLLASQQQVNATYTKSLLEAQAQVRTLVQDISTMHDGADEARRTAHQDIAHVEDVLRQAQRERTAAAYSFEQMSILTKRLYAILHRQESLSETVQDASGMLTRNMTAMRRAVASDDVAGIEHATRDTVYALSIVRQKLDAANTSCLNEMADVAHEYRNLREDSEVLP